MQRARTWAVARKRVLVLIATGAIVAFAAMPAAAHVFHPNGASGQQLLADNESESAEPSESPKAAEPKATPEAAESESSDKATNQDETSTGQSDQESGSSDSESRHSSSGEHDGGD